MNIPALTCFQLSVSDHIAHLVLSRPEAMNTMGPAFWRELDQALELLQRDGAARALVISSTGKHFSAGMALDVSAAESMREDYARIVRNHSETLDQLTTASAGLEAHGREALRSGREDLARQALGRRAGVEAQIAQIAARGFGVDKTALIAVFKQLFNLG